MNDARNNQDQASEAGSLPVISTFFGFDESMFEAYEKIQRHNAVIDEDREFRRLNAEDFESWLDPKWEFREDLLKLYDRITIDAVRVQLITYAALYYYGGWYLDPTIYLKKLIGPYDDAENILIFNPENHLASELVYKFAPKHPLPRDMLKAVVANSQNRIHLHDVTWFSGDKLLSAIGSRDYDQAVKKLRFDELVNSLDAVFETYKSDKELRWPILQLFGIEKGVEPDFKDMPKRITYGEADYILEHAKRYDLLDSLKKLREERPVYFSEIQKFDSAAPK